MSVNLLLLNNPALSGTIPVMSSSSNSSKLEYIVLYNCSFTGPIPSSLGSLSSLQFLELTENAFTGTIPVELFLLPNLNLLGLAGNQLEGTIPSLSVVNIVNNNSMISPLRSLSIGSNKLRGPLPEGLGRLSKLELFSVQNNLLTGFIDDDSSSSSLSSNSNSKSNSSSSSDVGRHHIARTVHHIRLQMLAASRSRNLLPVTLQELRLQGNLFMGDVCKIIVDDGDHLISARADCAAADGNNNTAARVQCKCCTECCDPINGVCTANTNSADNDNGNANDNGNPTDSSTDDSSEKTEQLEMIDIDISYSNSNDEEKDQAVSNTDDNYDYCSPCGPGQALSSEYDRNEVRVITRGIFTCKELYQLAKTRSWNPICALVQSAAHVPCGCDVGTTKSNNNDTNIRNRTKQQQSKVSQKEGALPRRIGSKKIITTQNQDKTFHSNKKKMKDQMNFNYSQKIDIVSQQQFQSSDTTTTSSTKEIIIQDPVKEQKSTAVSKKKDDNVVLIGTKMKTTQHHGTSTFHSNEQKRKNQAIVSIIIIRPQNNNASANANRSLFSSPVMIAAPESVASPDISSASPGTIIGTRDYYYYYYTFLVVGVMMVSMMLVAASLL